MTGLDRAYMEKKFGKGWTWKSVCPDCGKQAGAHASSGGDCPDTAVTA